MCTGEPPDFESTLPLREGARRRAAQGIELQSLLRAYRVGVRVMWRELIGQPEWQSPTLQGALVQIAEWALDFADRANTEVASAYLEELETAARVREHRRSALLNVILAGPAGEAVEAPRELERPHAVLVALSTRDLDIANLEHIGSELESRVDALLWTVRHRSVVAAVPVADGEREELLRAIERVAPIEDALDFGLGGNARGARQTRQSYAEAVEALRLGPTLAPLAHVYDYQTMAPASALLARPEQARRFALTALEPLGPLADKPWVLPTLNAYLSRQGRAKEVASLLDVHINTVKYRLRRLRERCGSLLADGDKVAIVVLALKLRPLLDSDDDHERR
jgi:DNA-binding PucR family transcriptional regulator